MNPTDKADEEQAPEIASLIQDLRSYSVSIRVSAIDALLEIGEPAVNPLVEQYQVLIKNPQQDPGEFRYVIAKVLVRLRSEKALAPLLQTLTHSDPSTRWTIAIILGQVGDPRATDELIEALSDQDPDIRRITLHAISHIHGDRVRAAITQCLEDEDPKVRRDAATILEKLKKEDR